LRVANPSAYGGLYQLLGSLNLFGIGINLHPVGFLDSAVLPEVIEVISVHAAFWEEFTDQKLKNYIHYNPVLQLKDCYARATLKS